MPIKITPTVLTIAGSDNYGGAGIQVDAKVIHTLGGYAFTAITALTAQNSTGVKDVFTIPAQIFKTQLTSILDDIKVDAVKIGMLANAEIISIISEAIDKYKLKNIVLDTVLVSSSGKALLEPVAIETMVKELFPRVDIITPNIPEVNTLLNTKYTGKSDEIEAMAKGLFALGAKAVLIKGGHSQDSQLATDYLVGQNFKISPFTTTRLHTTHTHGTGCVLSSAIATHLAKGEILAKSVELSKAFLYKTLHTASTIKFKYTVENDTRKEPLL
ncbi:bifunctional hydroxymethylpyrimidine kinase/phosphomethylpyrimidine kinase [Sulfurovum sp. CS9]|uniref:bifunctional hydroxymethylpyrimidine kinase/phosphomethylpyrimidine kinase n=1 Tax=Sulfurovum sp. CS9 TaxID=3391146 RepID=UPI0039EC42F3